MRWAWRLGSWVSRILDAILTHSFICGVSYGLSGPIRCSSSLKLARTFEIDRHSRVRSASQPSGQAGIGSCADK